MTKLENIRNFCIIAHIDHGKSTLADRLLEKTNTVALRDMEEQLLDNMEQRLDSGATLEVKDYKAVTGALKEIKELCAAAEKKVARANLNLIRKTFKPSHHLV